MLRSITYGIDEHDELINRYIVESVGGGITGDQRTDYQPQ